MTTPDGRPKPERSQTVQDPESPEEWQEAVDAAHGLLVLDAARSYGLVVGGPEIKAARCAEILKRGKAAGYAPADDAPERMVAAIQAGLRGRECP